MNKNDDDPISRLVDIIGQVWSFVLVYFFIKGLIGLGVLIYFLWF